VEFGKLIATTLAKNFGKVTEDIPDRCEWCRRLEE
jgi:hypothetical protein